MSLPNVGLCNTCSARVPAEFIVRDNQVWIHKTCPDCGPNESLVSSDAKAWYAKREMWQYVTPDPETCTLKCDKCRFDHKPNLLFLDVTNHCNMNCPICIASVPAMGFDFNPPLAYFEKIFAHVCQWNPKPVVQLFGGEPTVRGDLFEIIELARKYGLRANVTTNGLRLADEEYAKKFCDARVGTRFAFDGFSADIYEKLRNNRGAYEKKLAGLANLKKYARRKQAIISCLAEGINDQHLGEMVQYVHDNRDWINELLLIPLAETWDPKEFTAAKPNTLEDAEKMLMKAIEGGGVEFVPAGLSYAMRIPRPFFRKNPQSEMLLLAGVHPNCESMTALISDGKRYRGINHYLTKPFSQAAVEFAAMCRKMEPQLNKLDPDKRFDRLRGQLLIVRKLAWWVFRTVKISALLGANPFKTVGKYIVDKVRSKFGPKSLVGNRRKRGLLRVAMLPFEEQHSVDASRLENCKAVFGYEDEHGDVQFIPTCMWPPYRNIVLRKVTEKYGVVDGKGNPRAAKPSTPES
jgi:MoaA/NifB/PqqE/SkfB family radical SAM enzyme